MKPQCSSIGTKFSPTRSHFPILLILLLPGDKAFKYFSLRGQFSFKPLQLPCGNLGSFLWIPSMSENYHMTAQGMPICTLAVSQSLSLAAVAHLFACLPCTSATTWRHGRKPVCSCTKSKYHQVAAWIQLFAHLPFPSAIAW